MAWLAYAWGNGIAPLFLYSLLIYAALMTLPQTVPAGVARDENGVIDFTIKRAPHSFRIDDDVFEAPAMISPVTLRRLAGLYDKFNAAATGGASFDQDQIGQQLELMASVFKLLLPGAGGARFADRLLADPDAPDAPPPIDLQHQALPALYYLLECYGLRPTEPSSDSPVGSTADQTSALNGGTSSTAGASPEGSQPSD
jgi:hypothetical protein